MVAAGESFLRRSLEALFDLGRHVLAKGFGEPVTEYKAIARVLGERGVVEADEAEGLRTMAGYRNRLVHFYDEVTPPELFQILSQRVGEVRDLLDTLVSWVAEHPELVDESL